MKKILVIGQTPPPYHGQAIMIKTMLEGNYPDIRLFHIRMSFSREMNEIGKFKIGKFFHLFLIILKAYWYRIIYNINILYYPPSGPDKFPVIRDIIILASIRWMFKKTIFHFHAAGISEIGPKFINFLGILFNASFFKPDIAIRLSKFNPQDGKYLNTRKEIIIPNGVEDNFYLFSRNFKKPFGACEILFVGMIRESKGILVLIEAARILSENNLDFIVKIMGKYESVAFQNRVEKIINSYGLNDRVEFLGVLSGEKKYRIYSNAEILCFPSFYASESFGLVVVEAMQFCLPVVSTKWRGIQSLVEDEKNGYLVKIKDSQAIAEKLELLIKDPELRKKLGSRGRELYLQKYTIKQYHENMHQCFKSV
jgi:glycosyltransferase involved in cell wall biosynthesis